eukprot:TRINITY_DN5881_c0_g1_i3.p1 TRINITY_DN5881_c0_g1~~TRINITY_DN5881_c0_g1_i3.p1  ORF type:complete len:344 (+),score=39.74 TRINITY_DN5881_c0_g1_i3:173-1204(+)
MQSLIELGQREKERRLKRRIVRHRSRELFYCHTGDLPGSSWRTILASTPQLKVTIAGMFWYAFQMGSYLILSNLLVYLTFHAVPPDSPSYPGALAANGTDAYYHRELFDTGFRLTPDLSYRPYWLKHIFVDMMVTIAQVLPPIILFAHGHTKEFICYVGLIGIQNIMKGMIQIATILPAANTGEGCWRINFKPEELDIIRTSGFGAWFHETWGMTHGCNDMLWSGHTSQSCTGLLFLDKSLRHMGVPRCLRGILAAYFAVYIWAVLACRMHYSIDVLVAALLSLALYTHAPLRFSIWIYFNQFVGNTTSEEDEIEGSASSSSENGEDDEDSVDGHEQLLKHRA